MDGWIDRWKLPFAALMLLVGGHVRHLAYKIMFLQCSEALPFKT